jgi:hypothetical protein
MAKKIMARVREEAESKRGFIQKFFYPLHIKIPLEAFATVLIAVIAVYVFKAMEPEMKDLQVPSPKEPVVARQEAPYPAKAPAAETQALREKAVAQESPARTNGKDLAVAKKEAEERARVDEEGGGVGKLKEATPPVSEIKTLPTPAPPLTAPKKEAAAPIPAETSKIGESRTAERAPSSPAAAAIAPTQKDKMAIAEGGAQERKELKKAQPMGPSLRMAAKSKAKLMSFLVRVRDIRLAGGEAESLLHQLGASRIERISRASDEIITAEIKAEKMVELSEKLKLLGEVEEKDGRPGSAEKDTVIQIEIVPGR